MAEDENIRDAPTAVDQGPPTGPGRGRRRWPLVTAGALALVLLAGSALLWTAYRRLDGNLRADEATQRVLEDLEAERPSRSAGTEGAENILLIGSDDRSGANAAYGSTAGRRSDTAILLHLAADRGHATAVSIPRDAVVTVPSCERPDGTRTAARTAQFNSAYETGGAACTIRTVEQLGGVRIDHHLILDFTGFRTMVDAVGGVEVCVPQAVHDRDARLDLAAGRQTLNGEQALGYVRVRESLGDGSDTQRMGRQQQFLAALTRKVQSQGVLLNPAKLWPVLNAATSSITADAGLSSLDALYDLSWDLRAMPPADVVFLTAPRRPSRLDRNRDELVQPQTSQLFALLREDRRVTVRAPGSPTPSPSPATASASPAASASAVAAAGASGAAPDPAAGGSGAAAAPAVSPVFEGRTADVDGCTAR